MKNRLLIIVPLLYLCESLYSQSVHTDTLFVNEVQNTALFFHEPIKQAITGSNNFVFTYNRELQENFGLVQGSPGPDSNLIIISTRGSIYSFALKYAEKPDKLYHFISESARLGTIHGEPEVKKLSKINDSLYVPKNDSLLRRIQNLPISQKLNYTIEYGIMLGVKNILFANNRIYYVMQVRNNSKLPYEINSLELTIQTRKKNRRKSMQQILKRPIECNKTSMTIAPGQTSSFVRAYDKFSISDDRRVLISMRETQGERNLSIELPYRVVNNPTVLTGNFKLLKN